MNDPEKINLNEFIRISQDYNMFQHYNSALAYVFAEISNQTYNNHIEFSKKFEGFKSIDFIEVKETDPRRDVQAYVIITADNDMIVGFRGSLEAEDWLVNAKFGKKSPNEWVGKARVHKGFANAMFSAAGGNGSVYEQIEALKEKYQPNNLYLTGHSQGGSLANLYYVQRFQETLIKVADEKGASFNRETPTEELIKFVKDNERQIRGELSDIKGIYTYGEPKSMNKRAVNLFNSTDNVTSMFVYGGDLVSQIPFGIFGYKPLEERIELTDLTDEELSKQNLISQSSNKKIGDFLSTSDHHLTGYIEALRYRFDEDSKMLEIIATRPVNTDYSISNADFSAIIPQTYAEPSTTNVHINFPLPKNKIEEEKDDEPNFVNYEGFTPSYALPSSTEVKIFTKF